MALMFKFLFCQVTYTRTVSKDITSIRVLVVRGILDKITSRDIIYQNYGRFYTTDGIMPLDV